MKTADKAPFTPEEWERYAAGLTDEELWSKAKAINSINWVRDLEEEGYKPADITRIFQAFTIAFDERGLEPPGRMDGGYLDYRDLRNPHDIGLPD